MNALARALLDELDDDSLAELAVRLAPYLPQPAATQDQWMTARQAAEYLGLSVKALHHRTAAGDIPCHRDSDEKGSKLWFARSELDRWRRG